MRRADSFFRKHLVFFGLGPIRVGFDAALLSFFERFLAFRRHAEEALATVHRLPGNFCYGESSLHKAVEK